MTTITRSFRARRGLALGINSAGVGFGPLLAAPLATHLITTVGWRNAYISMAFLVGLIIPMALLLGGGPRGSNERNKGIPEEAAPGYGGKASTPLSGVGEIKSILKTRAFLLFCLMFLCVGICVQTVIAHIVPYSLSRGLSPMLAAAVLSAVTGTSMVGRITLGMASDRLGRRKALIFCAFLEGVLLLWLIGASTAQALFLFGVLFGYFYGGHAPQLPALVGEAFGRENMGSLLGVATLFWGVGSAMGPFIAGYLLDLSGSYGWGFAVAALSIFTASVVSFYLKSSKGDWKNDGDP
jgi:MFS family permease